MEEEEKHVGWVHSRLPFGSIDALLETASLVLGAVDYSFGLVPFDAWLKSYGLDDSERKVFVQRLKEEGSVEEVGDVLICKELLARRERAPESKLISSIAPGLPFETLGEIVAAARSYHGVPILKRTYRLRSYPACFVASDFVSWLSRVSMEMPREDAVALGQLLVEREFMKHVVDPDKRFADDYLFFRFAQDEELVNQGRKETTRDFSLLEGDGTDVPANLTVPDADEMRLASFLKREQSIKKTVRVIVIGGGFAGSLCLHDLAQDPSVDNLDVILIEPSDVFWYPLGAPRSIAVSDYVRRCCIPYSGILRNRFGQVKCAAKSVDPKAQCVMLSDGRQLFYDIVFIATGSSSPMPGKHPFFKVDEIVEAYNYIQGKVAPAKHVVVIGGGPVGVELAGEIAAAFPDGSKSITIVNSAPWLLNDPNVLPKLRAKVERDLLDMGVRIVHNDRLKVPVDLYAPQQTLVTERGVSLVADVVLLAIGLTVNNALVKEHFELDERGRLCVDPCLLAEGYRNVFAAGDLCNTKETKLGYVAALQGQLVAQNIILLSKHMLNFAPSDTYPLNVYQESTSHIMFVTLGPDVGACQLPGGFVCGSLVSAPIKSRNLFLPRYWKTFQVSPPSNNWW